MALTASERRIVTTIGQTLYPRDKVLDIDGIDAGVTDYVDDFIARAPRVQQLQLKALLRGIDAGFPVWSKDPSARLAEAPLDLRLEYFDQAWDSSNIYLQRMAFMGLRAIFNFAYLEADNVQEATGIVSQTEGVVAEARKRAEAAGETEGANQEQKTA